VREGLAVRRWLGVDYGFAEAKTTYGVIGVKVWVFKGEIFGSGEEEAAA
jgi:small subunit ribosomal protein S3